MKGDYSLGQIVALVPNFLKLFWRLMNEPEVPSSKKLYLSAVIAYVANPFDLIPDVIPVIGKLDDALFAFLTIRCLLKVVEIEVVLRHWDGDKNIIYDIQDIITLIETELLPKKFRSIIDKLDHLVGC